MEYKYPMCYFSHETDGGIMKSGNAPALLKTAGWVLLLSAQGNLGVTYAAGAPAGIPLNDLIQRSQFVLEARPIAASARKVTITFKDPTAEIPPLERTSIKFIRLGVMKNVLGSDLPDTLTLFEGNTSAAVRAHRALHASGDKEAPAAESYKSPIKSGTLLKQKTVILFLNQIVDDTVVTPNDRFELTVAQSYEPASRRKEVMKRLPAVVKEAASAEQP